MSSRSTADRIGRLLGPGVLTMVEEPDQDLWNRLSAETFDLLVVELDAIPSPFAQTIAAIRQLPDQPDIIVARAREDPAERAALLAAGAMAVIDLQLDDRPLARTFQTLIARRRESGLQRLRVEDLREPAHRLADFVSASPAMQNLLGMARRITHSDTSILVLGEAGVGKEWLARAIHEEGARSKGTFIAVNCGAIPDALLESELFGHEQGAFTGATRAHRGYFELAHRGTIFLDEIGEMPSHLQVKLLRVLQEKQIQRIGSERPIEIDARVMAASNRDLAHEMDEGRFRNDLFYRISVVTVTVPPLRDRREDIRGLVLNYFQVFQSRLGRPIDGVSERAVEALERYDWPGNVRELINVMERAVLLCDRDLLDLADLPEAIARPEARSARAAGERGREPIDTSNPIAIAAAAAAAAADATRHDLRSSPDAAQGGDRGPGAVSRRAGARTGGRNHLAAARREIVDAFEHRYLDQLLSESHGRIGLAARWAGITPRALHGKMKKLGLKKEDYREFD